MGPSLSLMTVNPTLNYCHLSNRKSEVFNLISAPSENEGFFALALPLRCAASLRLAEPLQIWRSMTARIRAETASEKKGRHGKSSMKQRSMSRGSKDKL